MEYQHSCKRNGEVVCVLICILIYFIVSVYVWHSMDKEQQECKQRNQFLREQMSKCVEQKYDYIFSKCLTNDCERGPWTIGGMVCLLLLVILISNCIQLR